MDIRIEVDTLPNSHGSKDLPTWIRWGNGNFRIFSIDTQEKFQTLIWIKAFQF